MARPGPKRKVSDLRLMFELFAASDNAQFASQVKENVPLETVQGVRDRLNDIVDETTYVEVQNVSGNNLYRLTDDGYQYVIESVRESID